MKNLAFALAAFETETSERQMEPFTHVVFQQVHPTVEVSVPFAEAAEFYARVRDAGSPHRVVKVHRGDPARFSWAKAWFFTGSGDLARIGAGAYGDTKVWEA